MKLKILITNDDGINAPGIRHLWNAVKDIAETTIIAPEREQSGVGLAITVRNPLHIESVYWDNETRAFYVSGTPADCVKLALRAVLQEKPDLILSGINRGTNAGRNILYSGTVGAALEGALQGVPSIAFSCCCDHYPLSPNYTFAEAYIQKMIRYVTEHPLPPDTMLNVNFPEKIESIQGVKLTQHGMEFWAENPDHRKHPSEDKSYYWLGLRRACFEEAADSDISWLEKGYVTAVPICINQLTHYAHLEAKRDSFEKFFE